VTKPYSENGDAIEQSLEHEQYLIDDTLSRQPQITDEDRNHTEWNQPPTQLMAEELPRKHTVLKRVQEGRMPRYDIDSSDHRPHFPFVFLCLISNRSVVSDAVGVQHPPESFTDRVKQRIEVALEIRRPGRTDVSPGSKK
jgi:hypothetical protein